MELNIIVEDIILPLKKHVATPNSCGVWNKSYSPSFPILTSLKGCDLDYMEAILPWSESRYFDLVTTILSPWTYDLEPSHV